MRKYLLLTSMLLSSVLLQSQTCSELMESITSNNYGTTYNSYNSDAISKVTFYEVSENFKTYYFAIVCFKKEYYGCNEYLYQVGSSTKLQYSMNYYSSAGKAFWKYIEPYNSNLDCAPDFE
jgi:hypothetical protein